MFSVMNRDTGKRANYNVEVCTCAVGFKMHKRHSSPHIRVKASDMHIIVESASSMRRCKSITCVDFCAVQLYAASQLAGQHILN